MSPRHGRASIEVGRILALCWRCPTSTSMVLQWHETGSTRVTNWHCAGTLVLQCSRTGAALARCGYVLHCPCTSTALALRLYCTGTLLSWRWCCMDSALALHAYYTASALVLYSCFTGTWCSTGTNRVPVITSIALVRYGHCDTAGTLQYLCNAHAILAHYQRPRFAQIQAPNAHFATKSTSNGPPATLTRPCFRKTDDDRRRRSWPVVGQFGRCRPNVACVQQNIGLHPGDLRKPRLGTMISPPGVVAPSNNPKTESNITTTCGAPGMKEENYTQSGTPTC